jgi:hypothetical protein
MNAPLRLLGRPALGHHTPRCAINNNSDGKEECTTDSSLPMLYCDIVLAKTTENDNKRGAHLLL